MFTCEGTLVLILWYAVINPYKTLTKIVYRSEITADRRNRWPISKNRYMSLVQLHITFALLYAKRAFTDMQHCIDNVVCLYIVGYLVLQRDIEKARSRWDAFLMTQTDDEDLLLDTGSGSGVSIQNDIMGPARTHIIKSQGFIGM